MKFENLSATMQNAVLNGAVVIAHGTGSFNMHLGTGVKRWDNAEHLMCDSCDNLAEEGTYNVIPVEVPPHFQVLVDVNKRLQAGYAVAKRLYVDAVRDRKTGIPLLGIMYALETGRDDTLITRDDKDWDRFISKNHTEAALIVSEERRKSREGLE